VAAGAVHQGRAPGVAQQPVEGGNGIAIEVGGAGDGEGVVGQAGGAHGFGFVAVGRFGVRGQVDDVADRGGAQRRQAGGGHTAAGEDAAGGRGEARQCGRRGGRGCGRFAGGDRGSAAAAGNGEHGGNGQQDAGRRQGAELHGGPRRLRFPDCAASSVVDPV